MILREAAKKVYFLVVRPLRGGGEAKGKGQTKEEKELFLSTRKKVKNKLKGWGVVPQWSGHCGFPKQRCKDVLLYFGFVIFILSSIVLKSNSIRVSPGQFSRKYCVVQAWGKVTNRIGGGAIYITYTKYFIGGFWGKQYGLKQLGYRIILIGRDYRWIGIKNVPWV